MGKYDKVLAHLPKLPPQDASYQDKVEAVKKQVLSCEDKDTIDIDETMRVELAIIAQSVAVLCEAFANADTPCHASVLMRRFARCRQAKEHLEDHVKAIELLKAAFEQLTIAQCEVEATRTIKFDDDCPSYRVQPEPYAKLEDNDKLLEWVKKNHLERTLTIPWPTLNSTTKELLVIGQPPPDGVQAYVHTKLHKNPGSGS